MAGIALLGALSWGGYSAWYALTLHSRAERAIEAADKNIASAVELSVSEKDLTVPRAGLRSAREYVVIGDFAKALLRAKEVRAAALDLVDSAQNKNTESYAHYFVDGEEKLKAGNLAGALGAYEKALTVRKGDKPALEKASICRRKLYDAAMAEAGKFQASGDLPGAVFAYEKALSYLPGEKEARKKLQLVKAGLKAAEEEEEKKKQKKIADCISRGNKWLKAGKYPSAAAEFQAAVNLGAGAEAEKLLAEAEKQSAAAKALAGREAARARAKEAKWQALIENMSLIPAGGFLMGSPEGEGSSDEHPRHKVYLDTYYIDKHEVTVAQYKEFATAAGREMRAQAGWSTDRHPVVNVDWNDAGAYCKWAGKRLPTEAEWEKAARGGTDTKYSFGNDESKLGEYAWYDADSNSQAHPVGQKKPNPYGLYDMHGNVWEWVSDWYDENYYKTSPANNPKGPDSGPYRGLRGGSWGNDHYVLRAALRYRGTPDNGNNVNGFRCVVVPAQDSK